MIWRATSLCVPVSSLMAAWAAGGEMPRLAKCHGAWQLMVDGKPFLMRGGEFAKNVYEAPAHVSFLTASERCRVPRA